MPNINTTIQSRIARIALNQPPVNAITLDFLRDFIAALEAAGRDESVHAIIIDSGVAGRFSAGLDLPWFVEQDAATVRETITALYTQLYDVQYNLGKPSIAAVGGTARGGGVTMAISCDVIVASDTATFGYPELDLGVPPAIHFAHLPRIVGRHRAFELPFSGRSFGAAEALEMRLISRVVPVDELDAVARSLAQTMAAKPRASVRLARAAFMRQNDLDYRRSIAVAVDDFCAAYATPDAQAAMRAFVAGMQKR